MYLGNAPADQAVQIGDGVVDTDQLAADAVTSAKIEDLAVDTEHIAASAVETAKINNDAVTLAKMASGTDGAMLTYDASGNPVAITGTDGQVATSAGANAVSAFEAAAGGITEADTWRLTTGATGSISPITTNLERDDTYANGLLGTGMSESSGVFTFPSTGYWYVTFAITVEVQSGQEDDYISPRIYVTTDNGSNWYQTTELYNATSGHSGASYLSVLVSKILDVTDTANIKVRFGATVENSNNKIQGHTSIHKTYMMFIRLAAT